MNATTTRLIPSLMVLLCGLMAAAPAGAQTRPPVRDVCVSIDAAHDTLAPSERTAARLLIEKQFTAEGWHVVPEGCSASYLVSHIRLGERVTVTMSGPEGRREGWTLGLDDLPALYSQMVRSIVTGRPMEGMNVIDRENVTAAQATAPKRVASDSFGYARLGYGKGGPAVGFGHRAEGENVALDVSFMNFQGNGASGYYNSASNDMSMSLVKLEALFFADRVANASAYYGAGISWGTAESWDSGARTSWHGSGLQGELTFGYEVGRASTLRVFVQGDATLPFYSMTSNSNAGVRYPSSFVVSIGLGWQRAKR